MKLSKIFASSCRQNIVRALKAKNRHIMELVNNIKSTYNETKRNLLILEDEEIVILKRSGRQCILYLNYDNDRTKILLAALSMLDDYDFKHNQIR